MIELYFLIYRIPKMMTALARERNRSALVWSLIGVGSWLAGEFIVMFGFGFIYGIGIAFLGWPEQLSPVLRLLMYIAAIAAIGGVSLARRILSGKSRDDSFPLPPPPPQF